MPALGEFELIRRYFTPPAVSAPVSLGVGDDCALLAVPPGEVLAVSVDTQVAGTHFHANAAAGDIASRALRCAASDLAAMGAAPLGFTLALTLPAVDEDWLAPFSAGLMEAALQLQCPLIGGDTTRGPLSLSVQVLGSVPAGQALRRSGARPGDQLWISGTLGDGAAALAMLEQRVTMDEYATAFLHTRFYYPEIDFALAKQLRSVASSCIDVSDGLLADLAHLCVASGVAARIHADALPLAPEWRAQVEREQAMQWALAGGDDYRLCFTAPVQHAVFLQSIPGICCIGNIVTGAGVLVVGADGVTCEASSGYRHF